MTDLNVDKLTPPPELVQQWADDYKCHPTSVFARGIAIQAARWGADQELEAFCALLYRHLPGYEHSSVDYVRSARRPKPPSLKEQSLALIDKIQASKQAWDISELDLVRRALEALPND